MIDDGRGVVYEAVAGSVRVFSASTLDLLAVTPAPAPGAIVAYDRASDVVYFLHEGRLAAVPASALVSRAAPPAMVQPPAAPVAELLPLPTGGGTEALVAVYGREMPAGDCYVFGQVGGTLVLSVDGGRTWLGPTAGLPRGCPYVTTVAASPAFEQDGALFAGVAGWGLFWSIDGGRTWSPSGNGLPSAGITCVLVSPGFAQDRTVFVLLRTGGLYRSRDAGGTWQPVNDRAFAAALSPEFAQDGVVMVGASGAEGDFGIYVSRSGGDEWEYLGPTPAGRYITYLTMAPLFGSGASPSPRLAAPSTAARTAAATGLPCSTPRA